MGEGPAELRWWSNSFTGLFFTVIVPEQNVCRNKGRRLKMLNDELVLAGIDYLTLKMREEDRFRAIDAD